METKAVSTSLDELCINTIRTLSIDAVQKAESGHPGLPMGAAPMAYVLWTRHLRHDPAHPDWPDRDRFVLSAGHGSMLLYSLLHLSGYGVSMEDLKSFRQWGSKTPGHPEFGWTPGVEATTGPLGQGSANAVGMAIAERSLASRFNRPGHTLVDHFTFALVSDGDLMEGISAEASSLAGHLHLGKLVYLYDSNNVSLDGPLSMAFSEDVARRYQSYGWQVLQVEDGNTDLEGIDDAMRRAKADTARPSLIIVRTTIGYGSPNKAGSSKAHGAPLGADEVRLAKENLGWNGSEAFHVPAQAREHFREVAARGRELHSAWERSFAAYARALPLLAEEWSHAQQGELPAGWDSGIHEFKPGEKLATREAGGTVLNALAQRIPWLIGGDADLSESTKTALRGENDFDGQTGKGRNLRFGVREHAMGGIANGIAYHGGLRPYASTFFVFSDYMRPSVRLAALSDLPVIYVWTHDSVALGEDGPTHQPIEHLASLRAMPNLRVVRPGDAWETLYAWRSALAWRTGPTALVFTRQKLPVLEETRARAEKGVPRGAYVLADADGGAPQALILATGSEIHLALEARRLLAEEGLRARVVSMPCWEAFAEQSQEYRDAVLPPSVAARVSVEAGSTFGWSRWVGLAGRSVGIDRFGASSPGETNLERLGITAQRVVALMRALV